MTEPRTLRCTFLGRVPYDAASDLQRRLAGRLGAGQGEEHLLLLEHAHVVTLGRSAAGNDVVAPPAWLASRGVDVAETNRGGQVTYHGPGQLVGYPILDLKPDRRDVRRYVHDLQKVLVRTLADSGIEARGAGEQALIGVWVGDRKIASLGVHLSRWITTHGFALNVSTDLSFFDAIVPCGLSDVRMTSMESILGWAPAVHAVGERAAGHLAEVFGRRLEWAQPDEVWREVGSAPEGVVTGA